MALELTKSNVPPVEVLVEEDGPRISAQAARKDEKGKLATREELDRLVQKYRAENKALQLRILGVNELARLLQDRTEVTEVLQEKNKRLEVAVVRLENRCSNFERKLRAQSGGTVGPKPGQSPFIPGPSRQILEALMKENSELKKTLNNVTKKGAAGYLEAVKTTQLEEVIDTQKQDIEFLKTQIQSLTNSSAPSEEDRSTSEVSLGLGSSFNSTIESAPLKQQLVKLRNALRVKDRFNSLLCQKVAEFEERVRRLQKDPSEETSDKSMSDPESAPSARPVQDTGTPDPDPYSGQIQPKESSEYHELQKMKRQLEEQKSKFEQVKADQSATLQKEREERIQLVNKLGDTEKELKSRKSEIEALTSRCEGLSTYNQTLVEEKSHLAKLLSDTEQRVQGSESATSLQQMEKELRDLQQFCDEQIKSHSEALQDKEKEIGNLRLMLEDAQYKFVISESKLSTIDNEKKQEIEDLKDKVEDLEMEVNALQNSKREDLQRISELHQQLSYYKASSIGRTAPYAYPSHSIGQRCGPILRVANETGPIEGIRDYPSKNATGPQTTPHVDQIPTRRAHSQQHQLSGHCGENIIDTTIRQEVPVFISRSPGEPENPPITTSAQKPSSLKLQPNLRMSQTHPHPMTTLSPSQYAPGNIPGMQNTPTTPLAPNQPVRSHSPSYPGYPRYTTSGATPYPTTSSGSYYYSRQPSLSTPSTVPYQYTPTNQKPVFGSGYTPSLSSIQSSGYGSMSGQGGSMASYLQQPQTASPQRQTGSPQQMYMTQQSKESGYNSMGSFPSSGLGASLPPQSPHTHHHDPWAYSQPGYHHTERRSSSPHEHGYQHP